MDKLEKKTESKEKNIKYATPGPIKLYPTYLDASLKCSEGRKVSKSNATENPLIEEIGNICIGFGLEAKLERLVSKYSKYKYNLL